MSWAPSARIVSAATPPAFRMRGLGASALLCWPGSNVGAGADYSVDFGGVLACDERIVQVAFSTNGGTIPWASIYGTVATAWIEWTAAGAQTVCVSVLSDSGVSHGAIVSIAVSGASLLSPVMPDYAPNAFVVGGVIVPDASGNPLILG